MYDFHLFDYSRLAALTGACVMALVGFQKALSHGEDVWMLRTYRVTRSCIPCVIASSPPQGRGLSSDSSSSARRLLRPHHSRHSTCNCPWNRRFDSSEPPLSLGRADNMAEGCVKWDGSDIAMAMVCDCAGDVCDCADEATRIGN